MKRATWNVSGTQGSLSLQRWANMLKLIRDSHMELTGTKVDDTGFPLPEAATIAMHNDCKCFAAPGTGPRVAFLVRSNLVPHILEVIYAPLTYLR